MARRPRRSSASWSRRSRRACARRTPRPRSSSRPRRRAPGTSAMWPLSPSGTLSVHVGPQFRRIRLGIVGGELGRLVDDVAHLPVDLLELVLAHRLLLQQPVPHLLDRVLFAPHLLHLFARAVL